MLVPGRCDRCIRQSTNFRDSAQLVNTVCLVRPERYLPASQFRMLDIAGILAGAATRASGPIGAAVQTRRSSPDVGRQKPSASSVTCPRCLPALPAPGVSGPSSSGPLRVPTPWARPPPASSRITLFGSRGHCKRPSAPISSTNPHQRRPLVSARSPTVSDRKTRPTPSRCWEVRPRDPFPQVHKDLQQCDRNPSEPANH